MVTDNEVQEAEDNLTAPQLERLICARQARRLLSGRTSTFGQVIPPNYSDLIALTEYLLNGRNKP